MNDIHRQIVQIEEALAEVHVHFGLAQAGGVGLVEPSIIESFSLIALGLITDYLKPLGGLLQT